MDAAALGALFTKPYGAPAPSEAQWRAAYADTVHFQDPTQEHHGGSDECRCPWGPVHQALRRPCPK